MRSNTSESRVSRALVFAVAGLQLVYPLSSAWAGVVPTSPGVSLDQSANGVPIVNIAKPGAGGISHNRYTEFDVDSRGLILNNGAHPSGTQLGGYITGNANLGGGSARLILNEVTASNSSQLRGYMEVAGQRAGVVVANPYGISCDGCGFINTRQATLSTGIPVWGANGQLSGFDVGQGVLRIDGDGLNAGNIDGLALYARTLELNAALFARKLDVVAGSNFIDADTGAVTPHAATGVAPGFAIDSSALGGMYADTIRLVGTEAGVGMRLAGPVAALTGQLEILSNGDVRLARSSANTDIKIVAQGNLDMADQASAGGDIAVNVTGGLTVGSGVQVSGDDTTIAAAAVTTSSGSAIAARGNLAVDAALQTYAGSLGSEGTISLAGTSIDNAAQLASATGLQVTAQDFRNSGRIDNSEGTTTLQLSGTFDNTDGSVRQGMGSLNLTASSLANTNGSITSVGDFTLTLPAFDREQSGGNLAAGGLLSFRVDGDAAFGGAELATAGGLRVEAGADIRIDSRIVAGGDIALSANDIDVGADGFVASRQQLIARSTNLSNLGVLYGNEALTLQLEGVFNNGSATGPHAAALLSEGDIRINALDDGKLQEVNNFGGLIESLNGSITLRAQELNNINVGWSVADPYLLPSTFEYSISESSFNNYNGRGRGGENIRTSRIETSVERHDFASMGQAGMIIAGQNITLDLGALLNDHSVISAADTLDIQAGQIANLGTTLTDRITKTTIIRWHNCDYDSTGDLDCDRHQQGPFPEFDNGEVETLPAVMEGKVRVIVNGVVVNGEPAPEGSTAGSDTGVFENLGLDEDDLPAPADLALGIVDPTALPGFNLPGNGIFHLNTDPAHHYLIETDPAINTYKGFLGSAYLLDHLEGWAPDITQQRLGDGFYEITLVREALLASLGSRFIDPAISDEKAQFEYLMNNAIAASQALHLSPGIALSREQVDALQNDIVWMEERSVAGSKMLVPVVYLAQGSSRILQDGSVISGGTLTIEGDRFQNAGLVRAHDDLKITVDGDIANRGGTISAGDTLVLRSGADILNESGRISGADVLLQADGDITHRTWSTEDRMALNKGEYWSTRVEDAAAVTASGELVQIAGGDIQLTGAALAGENISLAAGRNITLDTVKTRQGYRFDGADWQEAEEYVRHLETEVTALKELRIAAGADITAIAARLKAGGDATLVAGGSISLLAAEETDHRELHTEDDDSWKDKSYDLVHDESRLKGSTLVSDGDVTVNAYQGNVMLYGSTVQAGGEAAIRAGGDIALMAGVDTVQHREQRSESNAATFSKQDKGYVTQVAVASGISAGGDLNLSGAGNISLIASLLESEDTLRIGDSDVDQAALAAGDSAKLPLNLHVGTLELTNETWNRRQEGFSGPLEELVKFASFIVAPTLQSFAGGQIDMPTIEIGRHSRTETRDTLQVGSLLAARDIEIQVQQQAAFIAASVNSPGTVAVRAQDIVIDAAQETHHELHEEGSDTVAGLGAKLDKGKGEYRLGGVQETKTSISDSTDIVSWKGSTFNTGNLILEAEKNIEVLGSQLNVVADAIVKAGGDLTISGREGEVAQRHEETVETITVAMAVKNAYHDAVQAIESLNDAKKAVEDAKAALDAAERKAALGQLAESDLDYFRVNLAAASANLVQAGINAAGALVAAASTASATAGTGFYVSGSAQHDKVTTTNTTKKTVWQGSSMLVGGNAALVAGEALTVKGSDIAVDKSLVAGADQSEGNRNLLVVEADRINLIAGQERTRQTSKTTEEHETSSVTVTPNRITASVNGSYRDTDANSSALTNVNSHLKAGALVSRSDELRVAGAQLVASDVDIATGTLIVASLQDEAHSQSQTRGGSFGMGFGYGGASGFNPTSVSGGIEQSDSESESLWVSEQTRIIGTNSIRVRAQDTTLTGAVIAHADIGEDGLLADKGQLDFQTESLAVHDLEDYQRSKTQGFNFSTTLNTTAFILNVTGQPNGQTTLGGQYFGHETEQVTRATLGMGRIVIGGEELTNGNAAELGLEGINRDVSKAQEITKDQDIGGLNASISIDNRWVTSEGRASIVSDVVNVDNNLRGLGKLATATTVSAAVALASQLGDTETNALKVMANPGRAAEFVKKHPELAAAIEAYQSGKYDGLLKSKEGLQQLAKALGVSVEVLTTDITAKLGLVGTTDGKIAALDITGENRKTLTRTLGHEVAHNQGVKGETLADAASWAANLGLSAGLDFNNDAVRLATMQLGDGRDKATQAQNAAILRADNERLVKELADHGEQFQNLLSADQNAQYKREFDACKGLICKAEAVVRSKSQSVVQDKAVEFGFAIGLAQGVGSDVQGVATIVKDLPGALRGIGEILNNSDVRNQMGQQIHDDLVAKYQEVRRLLDHAEDAADMVSLGANLGQLTYEIVGYASLVKGAATTGTKIIAKAGKAGGEAMETLIRNATPPPALAVVGGGRVGAAVAMTGKPAGALANSSHPVLQAAAGATAAGEVASASGLKKATEAGFEAGKKYDNGGENAESVATNSAINDVENSAGLKTKTVISPERAEAFLIKHGVKPESAASYVAELEGPITARIVRPGEDFLRYYDAPRDQGSFLTKTVFDSPESAVRGLNLEPFGNTATFVQPVTSTGRTILLEAGIKDGGAGVYQYLIYDRSVFQFGKGGTYP